MFTFCCISTPPRIVTFCLNSTFPHTSKSSPTNKDPFIVALFSTFNVTTLKSSEQLAKHIPGVPGDPGAPTPGGPAGPAIPGGPFFWG